MSKLNERLRWIGTGILFAFLWASASTATKIGLRGAQPLIIAITRFGIAAFIMLVFTHLIRRSRLPRGKEWGQLAIYGLLNVTIYLGSYIVSMQHVTAGIGSLSIASNPVFISFLSVFFLRKKLAFNIIISIALGVAGVVVAAWPLLGDANVTTSGLVLLFFSMFSYSVGAIYFSSRDWGGLDLVTINGWQTLIGGAFLVPLAWFYYRGDLNHFDSSFWYCVLWLAIPVSIGAVQSWLWLLRKNPLKASLWLFLCPIFGFILAAWIMGESITAYTLVGIFLVILGLLISRKKSS